jgi:hypothetical protein
MVFLFSSCLQTVESFFLKFLPARLGAGKKSAFPPFFCHFLCSLGRARGRAGVWKVSGRVERGLTCTPVLRSIAMPTSRPLPVLRPERLRRPPKSFAWLDHRLRSGGFLAGLNSAEISLYCFLALAADARGLSCWRLDRIEREVPFDAGALRAARDRLIRADLLAFVAWSPRCPDGYYQLLALPPVVAAPRAQGCATLGAVLSDLGGLSR